MDIIEIVLINKATLKDFLPTNNSTSFDLLFLLYISRSINLLISNSYLVIYL